jgi:hypothetical protein
VVTVGISVLQDREDVKFQRIESDDAAVQDTAVQGPCRSRTLPFKDPAVQGRYRYGTLPLQDD